MIGKEIFSGWIIKELIGKGTYGKVYLAEKDKFKSAIKHIIISKENYQLELINKYSSYDEYLNSYLKPMLKNLENEIKIMEQLRGITGIVILHDYMIKESKDKKNFEILIRMEYLKPLNEYIFENGFKLNQVIKLGMDLSSALETCQKSHILHRDIKDTNILVDKRGRFKLADFGVAKNLKDLSAPKTIAGSYKYMAPEVKNGEKYDHRADIYSLGIVMHMLLNKGILPLFSDKKELTRLSYNNQKFFEIIKKACSYNMNDRFSTFKELNNALYILENELSEKTLSDFVIKKNKHKSRLDIKTTITSNCSNKQKRENTKKKLTILVSGIIITILLASLILNKLGLYDINITVYKEKETVNLESLQDEKAPDLNDKEENRLAKEKLKRYKSYIGKKLEDIEAELKEKAVLNNPRDAFSSEYIFYKEGLSVFFGDTINGYEISGFRSTDKNFDYGGLKLGDHKDKFLEIYPDGPTYEEPFLWEEKECILCEYGDDIDYMYVIFEKESLKALYIRIMHSSDGARG